MQGETRKRWEELCSLAETEQDPDKFLQLHKEITQLLGAKEERLVRTTKVSTGRNAAFSMSAQTLQQIKALSKRLTDEKDPRKFAELAVEMSAFLEKHVPPRRLSS